MRKGVITNPPVNEEPMTSQDEDGMSSFKKKKKKAGSVEGEGEHLLRTWKVVFTFGVCSFQFQVDV